MMLIGHRLAVEQRNTFGLEGARVFLKVFFVPLVFAKKPLRRSLRFFVFLWAKCMKFKRKSIKFGPTHPAPNPFL